MRKKVKLLVEEFEPRCTPTVVCNANPTYAAECNYLKSVIPASAITDTAVQSGNWSDSATWSAGVPQNGNVWIPAGISVVVDTMEPGSLRSVLVNGLLGFSPTANTSLLVNTIIVGTEDANGVPQGELRIGTVAAPIQPGVMATITFADLGTLASVWPADSQQLAGGLISMNTVSIVGSIVTPYAAITGAANVGSSTIILGSDPVGWANGDTVLLAGTSSSQNQDEQVTLVGISGNVATLSRGLVYSHLFASGQQTYVVNEHRNVVLQGQNTTDNQRFGHVMFMHTDQEVVENAAFLHLGRTDKSIPIGSAAGDGNVNVRGRYALHFHRDYWPGLSGNTPILVSGCFESGSPGWAYVNHSSDVDFEDNVAFANNGAAFCTEAGNEIGTFNANLAIRTTGPATAYPSTAAAQRQTINDFGWNGEGFWFQGPSVAVTNNLAFDSSLSGFIWYSVGLNESGLGTIQQWTSSLLPALQQGISGGRTLVNIGVVPYGLDDNNVSINSYVGAEYWWHDFIATPYPGLNTLPHDVASRLFCYGITGPYGMFEHYEGEFDLKDSIIVGGNSAQLAYGVGVFENQSYNTSDSFLNDTITGFFGGVDVPSRGKNSVSDGYYDCAHAIVLHPSSDDFPGYLDRITGNPQFGPNVQVAYFETPVLRTKLDLSFAFVPGQVLLPTGQQLYWPEEAPGYVFFPTASMPYYYTFTSPPQLVGLTNQQMHDQYGISVMRTVAAADARADASTNGIIGSAQPLQVGYGLLPARQYNAIGQTYYLTWFQNNDTQGNNVRGYGAYGIETTPTSLQPGWNVVSRTINGDLYTFMVFQTSIAPYFMPIGTPSVSASNLNQIYLLRGTSYDQIYGTQNYAIYLDLSKLPIQTRADGSRYVVASFTLRDLAGNVGTVSVTVNIV